MFTVVHTHFFFSVAIYSTISLGPITSATQPLAHFSVCIEGSHNTHTNTHILVNICGKNAAVVDDSMGALLRRYGVNSKGMGSGTLGTLSKLAQFVWCVRAWRARARVVKERENESRVQRWICMLGF